MDRVENGQPSQKLRDSDKHICPYLGVQNDPQTRYSFPETLNCCHRVSRPQRIDLDHQREVCLAEGYQSCPVYSPDWKGPLPKELRGIQHQIRQTSRIGGIIGVLVLVFIAAVFIFSRWAAANADPTSLPAAAVKLTDTLTPTVIPTHTPVDTDTPVVPSATLSPEPQITPTSTVTPTFGPPTPGPLENTPFGQNGRFVVHVVKAGELMEAIAKQYSTSPVVLKVINGLKPDAGFWPGVPVVVPVGEVNPNNVFAMQAVWIAQPMRVDVLAEKYATTEDDLRTFNGLGAGDTVPGGRWIVARKK